jgi:hypothetical protein
MNMPKIMAEGKTFDVDTGAKSDTTASNKTMNYKQPKQHE